MSGDSSPFRGYFPLNHDLVGIRVLKETTHFFLGGVPAVHFPGRLTPTPPNPLNGRSSRRRIQEESDRGNFPYVDVQAGMFVYLTAGWKRWIFF